MRPKCFVVFFEAITKTRLGVESGLSLVKLSCLDDFGRSSCRLIASATEGYKKRRDHQAFNNMKQNVQTDQENTDDAEFLSAKFLELIFQTTVTVMMFHVCIITRVILFYLN